MQQIAWTPRSTHSTWIFSDDAKDGTLGSTCLQALERGWVSSWRVGVSKPELLDKNNTPLVASEVILTHDYTDPDDPIECLTGYTMTSKIKRDWMKANPPPLREGTPNSELLGWFKGHVAGRAAHAPL